jgi:uncharacterized membrane protein YdbT with pleckstrin-like domain
MFEAAKILFRNINNNAKLALCFVNLEQFREAVDAATKANSVSTWKEVCYSLLSLIFLYLCLVGWSVWKRIENRFCDTLSL